MGREDSSGSERSGMQVVLFSTFEELGPEQVERGLRLVLKDGLAAQAMSSLTTGVFLVGLALSLGASNLVIGALAAVPFLTQLVQLLGIWVVERFRVRRAVCVLASALGRSLLLVMALTPWLSSFWGLVVLTSCTVLHGCFSAISNCAWNSWVRDLVPEGQLGSYFSRRMAYTTAAGMLLSAAGGILIDKGGNLWPQQPALAYSVLFAAGGGFGFLSVYLLWKTPEPRMAGNEERQPFLHRLLEPLQDRNFRNLIFFLGSWNFAINLAAPFFTVYLLHRLEYSMSRVIFLTILSQTANFCFLRLWGKLADRFNYKSILSVCAPLLIFCILGWVLVTFPDPHPFTLAGLILLHLLMGISTAGTALSASNIALKFSPKGRAIAFLASSSIVSSAAAGLAPVLGGVAVDYLLPREISWSVPFSGILQGQTLTLRHWDFLFLAAFLAGLLALYRLSRVEERGQVQERVIVQELFLEARRSLHNLSTAAGLRKATAFPLILLKSPGVRD